MLSPHYLCRSCPNDPEILQSWPYAKNEAIAAKLTDAPVLEFEKDYLIRANRLGLYTLASSITGVLSGVNGNGNGDDVAVFDLGAGAASHALRVELIEGIEL